MGRIQLEDSVTSAIVKMCDGNPGGLTVLMELIKQVPQIDPECFMGGLNYILSLDDLGLYGSRIWMLFKDVCGQEVAGVVVLFRANQLGHLSSRELRRIIDEDEPYDWRLLVPMIQKDVPTFTVPGKAEA
jgi:hypothetical protein